MALDILPAEQKTSAWGLFVLRLAAGGLMLTHGLPKLMDFSNRMDVFPDPLGVGSVASLSMTVFAEVFCALAVVLGIKTRYAVIPLVVCMLVAAFVVHWNDPFGKKELALMYLAMFITILLSGGGALQVRR